MTAEDGASSASNFTSSITAASVTGESSAGEGTGSGDEPDGTTSALDAADDDADATTAIATAGMDETTDGGTSDGSTSDGQTTGEGSTGVAIMCPQTLTCGGAVGLGAVSGDTGSPNLAYNDTQPAWVEFRVTEDNDDVLGEALNFTVTLTSPACCDFDLFVYRGVEGGNTGCDGFLDSSSSSGAVDTVSMSWGEGLAANGIDDTVWVAVEVVPKNDDCDDNQSWNLEVEGDL